MAHEPLRLHLAFQLPQRERLALLTALGEHDLLALRTLLPLLDVVGIAEPLHKLQLRDHNLVHSMFLKRRLGEKQGDGADILWSISHDMHRSVFMSSSATGITLIACWIVPLGFNEAR